MLGTSQTTGLARTFMILKQLSGRDRDTVNANTLAFRMYLTELLTVENKADAARKYVNPDHATAVETELTASLGRRFSARTTMYG